MKYINNGKMYVQLRDLSFVFLRGSGNTPKSVFDKALYETIHMNDDTKYDYIEFDTEEEIRYFNSLSFIIDKDTYENKSEDELFEELIYIQDSVENVNRKFKNPNIKFAEYAMWSSEYNRLMHKYDSVKEIYNNKHNAKKLIK